MAEDAKLKIGAEGREALRELARVTNALNKMKEEAKKVKTETRASAKARKDAFGSGALTDVRNYALGLASVGTVVAGIRAALRMMKEETRAGVQGIRAAEFPLARLAQVVSPGRPHEFLIGEAQKTRAIAGMPIGQAAEMQFALESARMGAERPWLARLFPMMDPVAVSRGAGAVIGGFGAQAAGTPRQVVNMLITAAKRASGPESNVTVGEFAAGLAPFGQAFKEIGGRPEELMAAVAVVSRIVGPKKGGMGVGRLAEWIAGKEQIRLHGLGFFGAVEQMREETAAMSLAERGAFVKERRAARGFSWVRENWEAIQAAAPEIARARGEPAATDPVARMIEAPEALWELRLPAEARRAKERLGRARETDPAAIAQQIVETRWDEILAEWSETEASWFKRWFATAGYGIAQTFLPKTIEPALFGRGRKFQGAMEEAVRRGTERGTGTSTLGGETLDPQDRVGN